MRSVLVGVLERGRAVLDAERPCRCRCDHSSESRLLTARSRADRPEAVAVAAGQQRRHVAAVAAAEHADPVGVAERVAVERGVEHGEHVVDVDRCPSRCPGRVGCFGPDDRLPPRRVRGRCRRAGCDISTTNPAAACIWASSKNVSPYCVNGPPWTLSSTGYAATGSKPAGPHDPGVDLVGAVGASARRTSPSRGSRGSRAVTGPSSVTISAGCSTVGLGHGDAAAGGVEAVHRERPAGERLRGRDPSTASRYRWVSPRSSAVASSVSSSSHTGGRTPAGRAERAVERRRRSSGARRRRSAITPTLAFCGYDRRVVDAEERDAACRRATPTGGRTCPVCFVSGADLAVERHDVEVVGEVAVPAVVALRRRDDARRVGQPARRRRAGTGPGVRLRGVAGAVGGDDVDVLRAVEDPALVVEAGEERLDLARRLPALVLGLVAGVAGAAGEGQPACRRATTRRRRCRRASWRRVRTSPGPSTGSTCSVASSSFSPRRERKASQRPSGDHAGWPSWGPAVTGAGSPSGPASQTRLRGGVLVEVDRRHDEGDALAVGRHGRAPAPDASVEQAGGDVGVRRGGWRSSVPVIGCDGTAAPERQPRRVRRRERAPAACACRPASARGRRPCAACTRGPRGGGGSGTARRRSPRRRRRRPARARAPRPAARTTSVPPPRSSPPRSMSVLTPCGHRQLTRRPRSPYVIDSHSAKATAARLVTVYGAEPIWASSPAADAVEQK